MNITASLKRAPKWAWYTAAGVGLGGAAIKLWRDRDNDDAESEPGTVIDSGSPLTMPGSPAGVIVPPVIIRGNDDDPLAGVPQLQSLYLESMHDVLEGWERMVGPLQDTQSSLLLDFAGGILDIAKAGGPPRDLTPVVTVAPPAAIEPIPVAPAPAPAAPAPAAAPAPDPGPAPCPPGFPNRSARGCYRDEQRTRCECNGRTGAARRCWTSRDYLHIYDNGATVNVGEDKLRDGC